VFAADGQASLKHIRQVRVSKCDLVKAHLCVIYGTDFSADDSVCSLYYVLGLVIVNVLLLNWIILV
jgi:hypothetical protein